METLLKCIGVGMTLWGLVGFLLFLLLMARLRDIHTTLGDIERTIKRDKEGV